MGLANYGELKDKIAAYLARDDLGAHIPDCIRLVESRVNRVLKDNENEFVVQLTPDANGSALLPVSIRGIRNVNCGDIYPGLEYLRPEEADRRFASQSGTPVAYTIIGQTLIVYPSSQETVYVTYYQEVPALSDSAPVNWLLEKHPDVYLFGGLVEARLFVEDSDDKIALWEQKFKAAIEDMTTSDRNLRWGNARAQLIGGAPC